MSSPFNSNNTAEIAALLQNEASLTLAFANDLDSRDPLAKFRDKFQIPSKNDLKLKRLSAKSSDASGPSIYLCGNSLGLQPHMVADHIVSYLETWATQGVLGHFKKFEDSTLPTWLDSDEAAAKLVAPIVGASPSEVAVMGALTANLHVLMASFYVPEGRRTKIIIEGKAFPSDHYAVESQIRWHGLDPVRNLVLIKPEDTENPILSTAQILEVIGENADETALLLLPGVQFYTGQAFDMKAITAFAQGKGVVVGWDLAHAVGNIELQLHDWNVDFAAWCSYKYLNAGPGAIGGLFVHERHGLVDKNKGIDGYRPRLAGWWGGDKSVRFKMENTFVPIPGAHGYQISNTSALDLIPISVSLEIFNEATVKALRHKSIVLTSYLEHLLLTSISKMAPAPFVIITPTDPAERGAQLSIRLLPGLLKTVMKGLEEEGVVVDEREPDVVRVAPAPLYNSFSDVWHFCQIFSAAVERAIQQKYN